MTTVWEYRTDSRGASPCGGADKGGEVVDDQEVIARINQLADEEHELFGKESQRGGVRG